MNGNVVTRPRREGKYLKLDALWLLPGSPNIDAIARQCVVLKANDRKGHSQLETFKLIKRHQWFFKRKTTVTDIPSEEGLL